MGLLGSLFGGSKSKSTSDNQAYGTLNSAFAPNLAVSNNAFNNLAGSIGDFNTFKKNSGYDFALNTGTRNISGSAAARGLLNSGSTAKALAKYETDLGSQAYGNWLDRLGQVVGLGNQQAGLLAGAGQRSSSSGSSNGGILSSLFSDRRLKEDIVRVGTLDNGLPVYSYRYKDDVAMQIGLMADEVEQVHPEAVFTHPNGFKMVDYGKAVL